MIEAKRGVRDEAEKKDGYVKLQKYSGTPYLSRKVH